MNIHYEAKFVYRVWYGSTLEHEAFFTNQEDAAKFAEIVGGQLNRYRWQMQIEE